MFLAYSSSLWWITLKCPLLPWVPNELYSVGNGLSGDCYQPLEWGGFISRYLLSPCHEILSQPLITGFCFLSPPWPFVHWQCSGGGNQEPGWLMVTRLPCVSPRIYPGHIWDSHSPTWLVLINTILHILTLNTCSALWAQTKCQPGFLWPQGQGPEIAYC